MQTAEHTLADLVDLERLQRMCDSFAAAGDVGLAVLDRGGTVLVSAGWQDICKHFHRVHADTLKACRESDARIGRSLANGPQAPEPYAYQCANGLWDVAFPLIIAGEHLGNVFTGQFFYDDDPIDVAAFRERAQRLGFDEAAYLEALARVPVLAHERVAQTISFLADFVGMLGDLGLGALRQEQEREALAESEERLEEAQGIARLGRWELDLVNDQLHWSSGIFALFEVDPSRFGASYQAFLDAIHPDDRDAVNRAYRASLEDRRPYEISHRLLLKDGRVKWVHERCRSDFDAQGKPLRSIGVVQEVTEQMLAEDVLRESEAKYREVVERANDGIVILQEGLVVLANEALARMSGYSVDELAGLRFLTLVEEEQQAQLAERIRRRLAGEEAPNAYEIDLVRKNGTGFAAEVSAGVITHGGASADLVLIRDVTERKRADGVRAFLARTGSGTQDEPFFQALARYLAEGLGMDFVCIDRLEGDGLTARTVAVWCDGHFEDNVVYALEDTPCGDVVGQSVCCFPASVCRYFPRDQVLQDLRAESYLGVTLFGHSGRPIGLIAVISRRPLANRPQAEATLQLVAVRAAGELERLDAEEALRAEEEKYRILTESMKDVVWTLDTETLRFLYVSPSVEELRGFTPEEIMAEPLDAALTPEAAVSLKTLIRQRAEAFRAGHETTARFYTDVVQQPRKGGSTVWTEVISSYHLDEKTGHVVARAVTRDIATRKRVEDELAHLNEELVEEAAALAEANATITRIAATDDLTGLANRRHFYESLEKAVSLARRHGSPLALVSFDLDGLKRVNDSAGHPAGDEVLASFAALLAALCRAEDLPARLGGDEFSLLLPGIDLDGGRGLAERVLAAVRSCEALAQRGVTVSGGIAAWSPGEIPGDLLRRADKALYAAKRGGGDAVTGDG